MKVYREITLDDFKTWSGATETKDRIINAGMGGDFERMIEELYPEGIYETELNDILWFDSDRILSDLGIPYNE